MDASLEKPRVPPRVDILLPSLHHPRKSERSAKRARRSKTITLLGLSWAIYRRKLVVGGATSTAVATTATTTTTTRSDRRILPFSSPRIAGTDDVGFDDVAGDEDEDVTDIKSRASSPRLSRLSCLLCALYAYRETRVDTRHHRRRRRHVCKRHIDRLRPKGPNHKF